MLAWNTQEVSTRSEAVIEAYNKGYRVNEGGEVVSPKNVIRKTRTIDRHSYRMLTFNVSVNGLKVPVAVHRLVAYQKFNDEMLKPGIMVRHLDGNSLNNSPSNIAIGTASDNAFDIPEIDRIRRARVAGSAHSLPEEVWVKIESEYANKVGYKKLAKKYGVPLSTLSYRLSKRAKKTKFAVDKKLECAK